MKTNVYRFGFLFLVIQGDAEKDYSAANFRGMKKIGCLGEIKYT